MGHRDGEVGRSQIPPCHDSCAKQLRLYPPGNGETLIKFCKGKKYDRSVTQVLSELCLFTHCREESS